MQNAIRPHHVGLTVDGPGEGPGVVRRRAWASSCSWPSTCPAGRGARCSARPAAPGSSSSRCRRRARGAAGRAATPRCRLAAWARRLRVSTTSMPSSRGDHRSRWRRGVGAPPVTGAGTADGLRPRPGRQPARADRTRCNEPAARLDRRPQSRSRFVGARPPAPRVRPGRARRHPVERRCARRSDADRPRRDPAAHRPDRGARPPATPTRWPATSWRGPSPTAWPSTPTAISSSPTSVPTRSSA